MSSVYDNDCVTVKIKVAAKINLDHNILHTPKAERANNTSSLVYNLCVVDNGLSIKQKFENNEKVTVRGIDMAFNLYIILYACL